MRYTAIKPRFSKNTKILLLLFLGVLMSALDISVVGPAIPAIEKTMTVTGSDLSWIFSIYVLFNLFGIPLMFKLSDTYGRRSVYILSVSIFGLGSLLVFFSENITLLLLGRAIQGFGSSGIFPVAAATIGDVFVAGKRGKALGILGGVYGIAFILGPIIAGTILHFYPWNVIFLLNLPIAVALIIFSIQLLPGKPAMKRPKINWVSIVLLVTVLSCFTIGLNNIKVENFGASIGSVYVLINDILDIARIESNQLKIIKNRFGINNVINEIVENHNVTLLKLAKHNKVQLLFNPPDFRQEYFINSDKQRFSQIIDNLIGNAIKFTDAGTVEIGYSLYKKNKQDFVQFYVKDSGIGMNPDDLKIIFERFIQAENNKLSTGTGLGLSISRGLVTALGGQIWVKSEINKGTTFYFTLPYEGSGIKSIYIDDAQNISEIPNFSGKLIYIAEDDEVSCLYLKEILHCTKAKLVHALNGKILMEMIKTKEPDLILLDINMPGMNGYQVLDELKQLDIKVPVIVQTAYAMANDSEKFITAGANDYISKPISQVELLMRMNRLLIS